ncbi:MAG: SdrD B-like domain-containing protein, partial [Peptostreptococcaceae bacterium]
LDSDYTEEPNIGMTYSGGNVDYKLVVTNTGNLNFEYLQIVDILPHIDDTGVILNTEPRDSEFTVYNSNVVTAVIIENDVVIDSTDMIVEYSRSYDPVRFSGENFGNTNIGTVDDWSTTAPSPITDVKSIKITPMNKILYPNQSLVIDVKCLAAMGVSPELVAWNSFAVKASYRNENNVIQQLIPVEPEKVGVRVLAVDKASISGITWLDKNENGNIDTGEPGINGITVNLLSPNNTILATTVTTNNSENNPGYYLFNNLDVGDYYVQFIKPSNLYFTIHTSNTQNKADTNTGKTEKISIITQTQSITDIDAGFIEEINFVYMLLEVLNHDIFSSNCESMSEIISSINYANSTLIGISNSLITLWTQNIIDGEINDLSYKSQLQRLIYSVQNILIRLMNLNIPSEYCNISLLANIVDTLIVYTLDLITILENNDGLIAYYNKCACMGIEFYDLLMGRFINSITMLNQIPYTLNNILSVLFIDLNAINKPYVAAYVPRTNINIPPNKPLNICCPPNNNCNK